MSDETILEARFEDFTPEFQKKLLEFFEVSTPEEMNWEIFPVVEFTKDAEEPEEEEPNNDI